MRQPYERTYTLDEMLDVFGRLSGREGSGTFTDEIPELRELLQNYRLWVRRRIPLDKVDAAVCRHDVIGPYRDRRLRGSRFPPIVVVPYSETRSFLSGGKPRVWKWDVVEGNHRVVAAREAGDKVIDAFIPVLRAPPQYSGHGRYGGKRL